MQPGREEIIVLDGLWTILLLAALPGAGNLAGGLIAEVWRSTPTYLNWALHAASGIVIAVVAVEILPEALRSLAGWWIALAFLAGGIAYIAIETMIDRLRSGGPADDGGSMWMIYVAVAMDLTSDGLLIGTGSAVSPALALVLAAGQVLADDDAREDNRRSVLAFVGGFALFTLVSAGLERVVDRDKGAPGGRPHLQTLVDEEVAKARARGR